MEILRGYGMGPNMDRLLVHHWDNQQFVPMAVIFLGKSFCTGVGVMQGNPAFPIIFNIVVYVLVRAVLSEFVDYRSCSMVWAGRRESGIWCSTQIMVV